VLATSSSSVRGHLLCSTLVLVLELLETLVGTSPGTAGTVAGSEVCVELHQATNCLLNLLKVAVIVPLLSHNQ
jgi:hypothetical protein